MKHNLFKRTLSVLLSALLLLGMFPGAAFAASDTTPPVLKGVSFSSDTVAAPGEVTVTVDAADDLSGIEMCRIALYSTELDKTLSMFLMDQDGVLQGVLELDEFAPAGVFKIVDIFLQDYAGNYRDYSLKVNASMPNQELLPASVREMELKIIAQGTPDTTPPKLRSIEISAYSVDIPGSVEITAYVTDDLSGASFCQLDFCCQDEGAYYSVILEENNGILQGTLNLDQHVPAGVYQIVYAYVKDVTGNGREYRVNPDSGSSAEALPVGITEKTLEVKSSAPKDNEAPYLTGATLSADSVTVPGEVTVTFSTTDDVSGADYARMTFFCRETGKELIVAAELADGTLQGTLKLNAYVPEGEYTVTHAYVSDAVGRGREYSINAVNENGSIVPLPDTVKALKLTVAAPEPPEETEPQPTEHVHTEVIDKAVAATCTTDGLTEGKHCSTCGEVIVAQQAVKAAGHKEVVDAAVAASCTRDGKTEGKHCDLCGAVTVAQEVVKATGHKEVVDAAVAATCTEDGKTEGKHCSVCEKVFTVQQTVKATGHKEVVDAAVAATCTKDGKTEGKHCSVCGTVTVAQQTVKATGHKEVVDAAVAATCTKDGKTEGKHCSVCGTVTKAQETVEATGHSFENGRCSVCGEADPNYVAPVVNTVTRVFGADRYATSFKAADTLKSELGVSRFQNIIVASGTGFADALAGSYLAAVKEAPILLVRSANVNAVKDYIKQNLTSGGTVYLLGGVNAVPKTMESGLDGFNVKRLGGADRYETNLLILKEAGVGNKDIIVCTGLNFADSLSASASGLPILLVKGGLTNPQKEFLKGTTGKKIIVGGTAAVSGTVESQLKTYGSVKRLAGDTRYDTSVLVAKEFFSAPKTAVLAYAQNFPDGLSGGPLAYTLKAPLILTDNKKPAPAVAYATGLGIKSGYVLGGTGLISDKVAKNIFSMAADEVISVK